MILITVMTIKMTLIMVGRRMLLSPTCPGPTLFTPATRNSYSIPFSSPEISWDVKNTMMCLFIPCKKIYHLVMNVWVSYQDVRQFVLVLDPAIPHPAQIVLEICDFIKNFWVLPITLQVSVGPHRLFPLQVHCDLVVCVHQSEEGVDNDEADLFNISS